MLHRVLHHGTSIFGPSRLPVGNLGADLTMLALYACSSQSVRLKLLADERQSPLGTAAPGSIKQVANEAVDRSICAIRTWWLQTRHEALESFGNRYRSNNSMNVCTYLGPVEKHTK
jgi:hypothetical protein